VLLAYPSSRSTSVAHQNPSSSKVLSIRFNSWNSSLLSLTIRWLGC